MPKLPFYRNHPRFNCLNPRGDNSQEELYEYEYDNAGRPVKTYHTHNKGERILLSESVYDDLGRLQEKRRHNDMDTVRYEYNIRNWVSAIKSRSFVQKLYYDTGSGSGFVPRYNGNIAGIGYEQNGHSYNYLFLYDGLNRLTAANSYDKAGSSVPYSELYEYDKMGNITYLERKLGENKTDALNIQYTGNQIKKVSSGSPVSGYDFGSMSYPDLSDASIEYYYDNNGNLIKNLDKGVVATRHNFLNLPDTIQFQNGNQIINSYLADGRKVKAVYKTYSTGIVVPQDAVYHGNAYYDVSTDEWDGHYMYRSWYGHGPKMFMVQTSEGYVGADYVGIDSHRDYAYYYYVHDHLGNVRITRNSQGYYADQSLEYYPSGVLFDRSTEKERQPYMFGGKELVSMHGLNEYDFTGRWQYSIIPSFTSMDPLCEKYYSVSPYVYCLNNPLKYVDPDGKQVIPVPAPVPIPLPIYYPPHQTSTISDQDIIRAVNSGVEGVKRTMQTNLVILSAVFLPALSSLSPAINPDYEHQRNRDRRNKRELDQQQANIANSIDTNISGTMPNGDPAPKRDPNDGRKGTKTAFGVITVAAGVSSVLELTNPDPSKDAVEAHKEKAKSIQSQPRQNDQGLWKRLKEWIFNK
ncbi:RHS repeat domain-containing protein [Bacteroides salyersiae]|uniref:RHS repeat domain-containing protein n=3 Tax=Bacteroides salyersiae TaxID=291644 RepID=UPI001D0868BC|nr:RHS repeat-associated core domain-containing protein [Bacteroides salyersiae]MCB6647724.1 hypothetical protein [Bacteroides salyersiae]